MIIKSEYELCAPLPTSDVATTLLDRALQYGRKTALVHAETGQKYTYEDLRIAVQKVGQALFEEYGLRKGDVILLLSPNCPEYLFVMLGALSIGVMVSTANPLYAVGEAVVHLEDCGAKFVFTTPQLAPKVLKAFEQYTKGRGVFVFGETPGCMPYASLLRNSGNRLPHFWFDIKDDVALLPYSSGTTGRPKGVMLTHYNVLFNILQCSHPKTGIFEYPGHETALQFLPMYHMFGIMVMLTAMREGNTLVVMPKYELHSFIRYIKHYQVTSLPLVPPVLVQLAKSPHVAADDLKSVNTFFASAAPVGRELAVEVLKKYSGKKLRNAYGMTEMTTLICSVSKNDPSLAELGGTVGKLEPGVEARIVNPETGRDTGVDEEGEMLVRGGNRCLGYYRQPQKTREAISDDGWLHTGDLARRDARGYFWITDRLKELIKYKGNQVAPAVLESVLLGHPGVADCAVVGVPDEAAGELPKAYVVRSSASDVTEKQLREFVSGQVSPPSRLRGGVEFIDTIPKSPSGKILRRLLRNRAEHQLKAKL